MCKEITVYWCPVCPTKVKITKAGKYPKHKLSWNNRKECPASGQSVQELAPDVDVRTVPTKPVQPPVSNQLPYTFNDGGRSQYKEGRAHDCVARAISIAAELDYKVVWEELQRRGCPNPDEGCIKRVWGRYLKDLGFKWVSSAGKGRTNTDHVPTEGRVILNQPRHFCAVINGVLNDTYTTHNKRFSGYYIKS